MEQEYEMGAKVVDIDASEKCEKSPAQWHKHWQKEMSAANKRLNRYLKQGNKVVQRYLDERGSAEPNQGNVPSRLNLFHKNISTMEAMLNVLMEQVESIRTFRPWRRCYMGKRRRSTSCASIMILMTTSL